jgi:anti-sigma factor RsiW
MPSRREIEELLPAYVNGSLTEPDRDVVERALADDPALQDELRFLEMLQDGLKARAAGPTPEGLGWHRLRRRIAGTSAAPPEGRHWWRQAAAVAAAVIILAQGGLLWQAYDEDAGYEMLAGESEAQLQVRFVPDASARQIAALLISEDLEIVSGPGAAGVYRLRTATSATPAEIDALVDRLAEHDAIVAFVARE